MRRWPLTLCLAATLAGCAANPMTGRSQLALVSENSVIGQARLAYAQELDPWRKQGKLDTDPALKARVDRITDRLIAQAVRYRPETASWDWQVAVIDDPKTLNAFCLPGGRMALYSGLVEQLHASDDEIAQVMGHEIAHALANHGAEKMSRALAAQGVVGLAAALSKERHQSSVLTGGTALAQLGWLLPNGRNAELEADRIGIELAARAGYNPDAGVTLWQKMAAASSKNGPEWLSTHPASTRRTDELRHLADYVRPFYVEAQAQALPTFARNARNVREVTPGGTALAADLRPLTLVSPAFEDFKRGAARLPCTDCALKFRNRLDEFRQRQERRDWEGLARAVLDVGYRQDIAWHFLGIAAEGLGLPGPARLYYAQAVELSKQKDSHCAGGLLDLCNGVRLPEAAAQALRRLGSP